MISVNKIVKKLAKGIKGYLRVRCIIKLHQIFSSALFLLFRPPSRFLGVYGSGFRFLGSLMVILNFPEVRVGLWTDKNKIKSQASIKTIRLGKYKGEK